MKIRTGFVSNSSSSSFIIGTKDTGNKNFNFSLDTFKKHLVDVGYHDEEDVGSFMDSYGDDITKYINSGYGLMVMDVDQNCYEEIEKVLKIINIETLIDLF